MKNILIVLIVVSIAGCNFVAPKSTKNVIVGKWELVEPVEFLSIARIAKMDVELTENGNIFGEVTLEALGRNFNEKMHGKYEVDGNKVLWDVGGEDTSVFTLSDEGFLTSEYTHPSWPDKKFTIRLKRKNS